MKFSEFAKNVKEKIEDIYLLKGDDFFVYKKAISLLANACEISMNDMEISVFDSENIDAQNLQNVLSQLPFCAKKRLVVLKNIAKITEQTKKVLNSYAASPSQQVCLALYAGKDDDDFSFLKSAVIVDCRRIEDAYIYKYIVSEVKKNGRNISDLAVKALIEMTNGNMSSICCEISKLCAIYSKDETINHLNVLEVVQKSVEYSIYELSDALSKRDGNAAISLIKNMLLSKEEPSMLLSLISSHFRRLLFVSISDISNEELAMLLGVKEYAIKKAKENAKLFSVRKLKGVNELLENVDYMQKSGEMSSENCLFYVVFNIIHEKDN